MDKIDNLDMRDILSALKPLKNRMHFNRGLLCIFVSISAGGAAATVLSYLACLVPVPYLLRRILWIYAAFAVLGLLVSLFLRPGTQNLLKTADSLSLKERLITAWELQNDDTKVALLQRQDTFWKVSRTDFKRLCPISFPSKFAMVIVAFMVLTTVSFFIQSPSKGEAGLIERLQDTVNEQLEELEKISEDLKNNSGLEEAELEKILGEIDRLTREAKQARTEEDALKALSRAENELKKMDMELQLNKLSEDFKEFDLTSELGEAMENDSITDIKQALEQLMGQMGQGLINPGELAEILKQMAEQADNEEVKEQLEKIAQQLEKHGEQLQAIGENGEQADPDQLQLAENAMKDLGDLLEKMMQSRQDLASQQAMAKLFQAVQQAKSKISQVDSSLSAGSQGSSRASSGQGSQSSQYGGASQGSESNQAVQGGSQDGNEGQDARPGQNQAGGQNQGGGQSAGEGQQPGGQQGSSSGRAGDGSTNEDSGYTGREQAGGGREPGEGHEEEHEQIYDPKRLGGDADPSYVSGQKHGGGSSSYSPAENVPVQGGVMRPYSEVLPQYSDEAALYMQEAQIPAAMKDIVRQYFEALQ